MPTSEVYEVPCACWIASDAPGNYVEDLVARDRVVGLHPQLLGQREAEAHAAAGTTAVEARLAALVDLLVEQVEAGREVAVEEARLGEAEVDLQALERAGQLQAQELAVAHQVALGDAHIADDAFSRRVAGAEGQLARRLLDQFHVENDAILGAAGTALHFHALEQAEVGQALLGLVDHHRIVGIALGHLELAPDDVVLGARVAGDVDALDVDARAFFDDVVERDLARHRIGHGLRANAGEGKSIAPTPPRSASRPTCR